jgi:hypothetical protein
MDWLWEFLSTTVHNLLGRASGPLHFRLFVMPTVVSIMAIRAHMRDIREGHPILLWAFLRIPSERRRLFRSGLKDFGRVFVIACLLDTGYQLIVLRQFRIGELLVVAVACAIVPYFLVRGPILRTAYRISRRGHAAPAPNAPPAKPDAEDHQKQE